MIYSCIHILIKKQIATLYRSVVTNTTTTMTTTNETKKVKTDYKRIKNKIQRKAKDTTKY